jgi:hypothetical protein
MTVFAGFPAILLEHLQVERLNKHAIHGADLGERAL